MPTAQSPLSRLLGPLGRLTGRADVPDLTGKVAVVSGFNSGIGFETTRELLRHNCEVIGLSRCEERGEAAAKQLREEFGGGARISVQLCDLGLMASVRAAASAILAAGRPMHILVNNAGRFLDAPFALTAEGLEQTLAADYYGHVLLTLLLLDHMMADGPARVVNVCSAEQLGGLDWEDMAGARLGTSGIRAYSRAKLSLLLFSLELQRRLRLAGAPLEVFATHPGVVNTGLFDKLSFRYPFAIWVYGLNMLMGQTPTQGAQSTVFAATSPSLAGQGGAYVGPLYALNTLHLAKRNPANRLAYDVDAWQRLWEETHRLLEEVTGSAPPSLPAAGTRV